MKYSYLFKTKLHFYYNLFTQKRSCLYETAPSQTFKISTACIFSSSRRLVLGAEKVVNGFDRIEGDERHFDKKGVPVRHGAVP